MMCNQNIIQKWICTFFNCIKIYFSIIVVFMICWISQNEVKVFNAFHAAAICFKYAYNILTVFFIKLIKSAKTIITHVMIARNHNKFYSLFLDIIPNIILNIILNVIKYLLCAFKVFLFSTIYNVAAHYYNQQFHRIYLSENYFYHSINSMINFFKIRLRAVIYM